MTAHGSPAPKRTRRPADTGTGICFEMTPEQRKRMAYFFARLIVADLETPGGLLVLTPRKAVASPAACPPMGLEGVDRAPACRKVRKLIPA